MKPTFAIIAAVDSDFGIGKGGTLPWQLSADMKHFKAITSEAAPGKMNAVVMGRKTWDSLPAQFRPLPGRINVVLTRQKNLGLPKGVLAVESLEDALGRLAGPGNAVPVDQIFVIGGEQIFRQAVSHPACQKVYLTHILKSFACDCFFPREGMAPFQQTQKTHPPADSGSFKYFFAEYQRARA